MPKETKFFSQVGYTSSNPEVAFLHVQKRTPVGEGLDYESEVIYYELRFNEDTSEVMLVKNSVDGSEDEIVYSEILDAEDPAESQDLEMQEYYDNGKQPSPDSDDDNA